MTDILRITLAILFAPVSASIVWAMIRLSQPHRDGGGVEGEAETGNCNFHEGNT